MKKLNTSSLIFFVSAFSTLLTFIFLLLLLWTQQKIGLVLWWAIPLAALLFLSYWLFFRVVIRLFLVSRVRLLYRLIQKTSKSDDLFRYKNTDDILKSVEREVENWADNQDKDKEDQMLRDAFQKEFIGNISHELKTPIFNIQGYILTLLEGGLEDKRINRRYLEKAEKSVKRLTRIVQDLNLMTQFEAGQMEISRNTFDLKALVLEVFDELEYLAQEKSIKLKMDSVEDMQFMVYSDRNKIRIVLSNLISNALHYGKMGGQVKVGFEFIGERVMVEVDDDGLGIDQVHLPRLFERFYRTSESRVQNKSGSGLGLAIVKKIIDELGEKINVQSTLGEGTIISFTLKRKAKS